MRAWRTCGTCDTPRRVSIGNESHKQRDSHTHCNSHQYSQRALRISRENKNKIFALRAKWTRSDRREIDRLGARSRSSSLLPYHDWGGCGLSCCLSDARYSLSKHSWVSCAARKYMFTNLEASRGKRPKKRPPLSASPLYARTLVSI